MVAGGALRRVESLLILLVIVGAAAAEYAENNATHAVEARVTNCVVPNLSPSGYCVGSGCVTANHCLYAIFGCNYGYYVTGHSGSYSATSLCLGPSWSPAVISCTILQYYCPGTTLSNPTNGYYLYPTPSGRTVNTYWYANLQCNSGYKFSNIDYFQPYICTGSTLSAGVWSPNPATVSCVWDTRCPADPSLNLPAGSICGNTWKLTVATCVDNSPGVYTCTCLPGANKVGSYCVDIDECAANPCGLGKCNTTLKDGSTVLNTYNCTCFPGAYGGGVKGACYACTTGCANCTGPGLNTTRCQGCNYAVGYVLNENATACTSSCLTGYYLDAHIQPYRCRPLTCLGGAYYNLTGANTTLCPSASYSAWGAPRCTLSCIFGYNVTLGSPVVSMGTCVASTQSAVAEYTNVKSFQCTVVDLCRSNPCGIGAGTCMFNASIPGFYYCVCNPGYDPTYMSLSCSANATYCGPRFTPINGNIVSGGNTTNGITSCLGTVGSTCTFNCSLGYFSVSTPTTTCQPFGNSGQWNAPPFQCQINTTFCAPLQPPANGGLVCDTRLGGLCVASCNPGFTQAAGLPTYVCQGDGSYAGSDVLPVCQYDNYYCPLPDYALSDDSASCNRSIGQICLIGCPAGFIASTLFVTCNTTHGWDGGPAQCFPDKTVCLPPREYVDFYQAYPDVYQPSSGYNTSQGGTVVMRCRGGWQTNSTATVVTLTCDDGAWDGDAFCDSPRMICPIPTAVNASAGTCSRALAGTCHYTCSPGTVPITNMTQTCLDGGRFDGGGAFICGVANLTNQCLPSPPNFGFINSPCNRTVGGRCSYSCAPGYNCTGGCVAMCQASLTYTAMTCSPQTAWCPVLAPPANSAGPWPAATTAQPYGTTLTVKCNPGYSVTVERVNCLASGQWDVPSGYFDCAANESYCPNLPTLGSHVMITSQPSRLSGGSWRAQCHPGYNINSASYGNQNCLPSHVFNPGPAPVCSVNANVCPTLSNGTLFYVNAGYSRAAYSSCQLFCVPGFQAQSVAVTSCQANGQWTTTNLTCTRIDSFCPVLSPVVNQNLASLDQSIGGRATFTCLPGFDLQGANLTCVAGFDPHAVTGNWNGPQPYCAPAVNYCAAQLVGFSQPNLLLLNCSTTYGQPCVLGCAEGYNLNLQGNVYPTCSTGGQYSPLLNSSSCTLISNYCPAPNYNNGQAACIGFRRLGDPCTPQCNTGYLATNTTSRTCSVGGFYSAPGFPLLATCTEDKRFCQGLWRSISVTNGSLVPNPNNETFCAAMQIACDPGYISTANTQVSLCGGQGTSVVWCFSTPTGPAFVTSGSAQPFTGAGACQLDPNFCPALETPKYATPVICDQSLGGTCKWQCAEGFFPNFIQRQCLLDAPSGQGVWSQLDFCQTNLSCPAINTTAFCTVDNHLSLSVPFGSIESLLTFTCNPGYRLVDPLAATRYCNNHTEWVVSPDDGTPAVTAVCVPIDFDFDSAPPTAVSGALLSPPPIVSVVGAFNAGAMVVSLTATYIDGSVVNWLAGSADQIQSDAVGRFNFSALAFGYFGDRCQAQRAAGEGACTVKLTATAANGLSSTSASIELATGPAAAIRFAKDTNGGPAGTYLEPPYVCVYDEFGNLYDQEVTVVLNASNVAIGTATRVSGETSLPTVDGCANFTELAVLDAGTTQLMAYIEGTDIAVPGSPFVISSKDCPPGEFSQVSYDRTAVLCLPCRAGTFSSARAQQTCQRCPGETYSEAGASSCLPCPAPGGNCTDGTLQTASGYYRLGAIFYACLDETACPGSAATNATCEVGYDANSFLCSECESDTELHYGRIGVAGCAKCFPQGANVVLLILAAVVVASLVAGLISALNHDEEDTMQLIRIALNYLQTAGLCSAFFVQSRTVVGSVLNVYSVASFSINVFPLSCLFGQHYLDAFVFYVILPIFCVVVPVIVNGGLYIAFKRSHTSQEAINRHKVRTIDHIVTSVAVLLFLSYPSVLLQVLRMFSCATYDESRLLADLDVVCLQGAHLGYVVTAAVAVVVWGVGVPAAGIIVLYRKRAQLEEKNVRRRYAVLFLGYKPTAVWWEFGILIRKALMIVVIVFIGSPIAQAVCGVFLVNATLIFQIWRQPYEGKGINRTEILCASVVTVTLLFSAIYGIQDMKIGATVTVTVLLVILNIACILTVIAAILHSNPRVCAAVNRCRGRSQRANSSLASASQSNLLAENGQGTTLRSSLDGMEMVTVNEVHNDEL